MMENISNYAWRYSINRGECGGIVFADTLESAEEKVRKKYRDKFDWSNFDTELLVWRFTEDDYSDSENPDVLDCYGL